ncbi:transcriptional regulator, MarR family [Quadrisphaera granulorum]|uniref:MarR family transcriptional regulator n=1 Tax=Quadrisphaera granulorum TaxID=317664 RepID=A0A316A6U8_9ACTN|nr:MarR family transcriptional regulator [Quadrisphaera granulorum]PWJ53313.1 MarR family transcriptional regulator [Quadrisphaera granulorum]SZE96987.1 transcriptional regulator, MarR family [Quadrisphaera granulorum]
MVTRGAAEHLEHELAVLLRRARGISGQLARDLHPDLEPGAYGLLLRVKAQGGARATDLASYLGIGKPTVSRQLATLERLGLIERSRDSQDARAQVVTLTPTGTEQVERVQELRRAHFLERLSGWTDDDVELLAGLLGRFNALPAAAEGADSPETDDDDPPAR